MKFTLTIDLGNDAMQTGEDIVFALKKILGKIPDDCTMPDHGKIMDGNGNTVGKWEVSNG